MSPRDFSIMASLLDEAAGHLHELRRRAPREFDALLVRHFLPDELEGSAIMLREHETQQTIDDERTAFEEAAYQHYLRRKEAGKIDPNAQGDGTREALFWKQPNGEYGVLAFNSAFWGWRAAKGLV